nr:MAG: hypothetical protein [Jingmen bat rhabdovirus 2]
MEPTIPEHILAAVPDSLKREAQEYSYVLSKLELAPGGSPYINAPVRAPVSTGRDWEADFIHQTPFYLPLELSYLEPNEQYGYESPGITPILKTPTTTLTRGHQLSSAKWSYLQWAKVALAVEDAQYDIILDHLPFFAALFNVTDKFGRPIDGGFMKDLHNIIYVDPPENFSNPPGPDPLNLSLADRGFAYWVLGVRVAIKTNPISQDSTMVSSLGRFLRYDEDIVRRHLQGFGTALKRGISTDKPICHSNAAARRGMNINMFDVGKLTIRQQGDMNEIVDENGAPDNLWTLSPRNQPYRLMAWGPIHARPLDIPNYNSGFWSFAQIGIEHNGWSAMELVNTGMLNYDLSWTDMIKGFPTTVFMKFMNKVFQEEALCSIDPWRSTSHLLLPEINTPLSATKNKVPAYIGICLNTPDLDPSHPPPCMSGVDVIPLTRSIIATIVQDIIVHHGQGATQPNAGISELFQVNPARMEANIQQAVERNKERQAGMLDILANLRNRGMLNLPNRANAPSTTQSSSSGNQPVLAGLHDDGATIEEDD